MDAVRQLILDRVAALGVDLKAASLAMGRNHAYLHQFINRGTPVELKERDRRKLSVFLEIAEDQLRHVEGADLPRKGRPALIASFDPDAAASTIGDYDPRSHGGVSTDHIYHPDIPNASPVIDTRAGAGPGSIGLPAASPSGGVIYSEDAILGEILLPGYLQREFSPAPPGRIHWVAVRGDSMEPTLRGGDHVAVDTTDTAIGQGGMFVARNGDGEVIVKRFFRIPRSDPPMIEIRSDNAAVEPPKLVEADWVMIIGRVVAKIGRIG